jgi:hypothetical protein
MVMSDTGKTGLAGEVSIFRTDPRQKRERSHATLGGCSFQLGRTSRINKSMPDSFYLM